MQKRNYLLLCLVIIGMQGCHEQSSPQSPKKEFYSKEFHWKITIPENLEGVSTEERAQKIQKGRESLEKTLGQEIVGQAKSIFSFKSGPTNYFESNYQPFDTATDGDYLTSCRNVNEILYKTFKDRMNNTRIDSVSTVEKIDNLDFQTFTMAITLPGNAIMHMIMYSRLFGKKEFTVNILYVDKAKGEQLLNAWKTSKFTN